MSRLIQRPKTLYEVAAQAEDLHSFGMGLRDWQHEMLRGRVRSRPELCRRIAEEPAKLRERFEGGDIADAYLAAYAEWIADQAGTLRPSWCSDPERVAAEPWFATSVRGHLLAATPASFRQRNLFTLPEAVFKPSAGRPRVSEAQKREGQRRRQKAYRARVREWASIGKKLAGRW